jgi:hypothetical protein
MNAMHRHWLAKILQILIVLLIVVAGFGQAVLQLWNHLMPQIFGLPALTFWQAVGLMALAWILFGSWRGAGYLGGAFGRRGPRAGHMTSEQRELFRKAMSGEVTAPQAR